MQKQTGNSAYAWKRCLTRSAVCIMLSLPRLKTSTQNVLSCSAQWRGLQFWKADIPCPAKPLREGPLFWPENRMGKPGVSALALLCTGIAERGRGLKQAVLWTRSCHIWLAGKQHDQRCCEAGSVCLGCVKALGSALNSLPSVNIFWKAW